MKTLTSLFSQFPLKILTGTPTAQKINKIVFDSRKVEQNDLFIAISGEYFDGHDYIDKAIEQGATAIVGEEKITNLPVPYIQVENARQALAHLSAAYYDYPARALIMIGITGTDGKTTTANFLYQILRTAGIKAGMISTVNAIIGDKILDTGFHVTTPDALDTQRYLAQMRATGLTHVILETTSHGWAQHRVDACDFNIGIITNITHEHLDYHGSFEAYRAAKGRLFESLEGKGDSERNARPLAILNRDDDSFDYLSRIAPVPILAYAVDTSADAQAVDIRYLPDGIEFTVVDSLHALGGRSVDIKTNLVGSYNVSNALAAFSASVYGLGIAPETASKGISALKSIPGRMERIDLGQNFTVIVDFAHTPNALKAVIQSAREMTKERVIALFGSAGLRDKEKRRLMAEISAEWADLTVLTAEDPRTESLGGILSEMAQGLLDKGGTENKSFWRVEDRGEAIAFALRLARPSDIVLICGKGHEQSMCFGETEYAWDDRTATRSALAKFMGIAGPEMPYLPTQ